jgi:uncharacterized membrane protein (UPF0136 family)
MYPITTWRRWFAAIAVGLALAIAYVVVYSASWLLVLAWVAAAALVGVLGYRARRSPPPPKPL